MGNGNFKMQHVTVKSNDELKYFLNHKIQSGDRITLTYLSVNYVENPIYTVAGNQGTGGSGIALGYKTADSLYGSVIYFAYAIQKIAKCDLLNGVWSEWIAMKMD